MKITDLEKKELIKLIDKFDNIHQILISLGVNTNGSGAYKTFKSHCLNLGVEIPKNKNKGKNNFGNKIPLKNILVEDSTYQNMGRLKKRLIDKGILEYECDKCQIKNWLGGEITLQLDHINGINNDNRIENLRLLCPNCHSQTKTYAGRNTRKKYFCKCGDEKRKDSKKCKKCYQLSQRKVERPPYEQLMKEIEELGYRGTGRKYGVSDNAIRKWVKNGNVTQSGRVSD